jgi:hypothetical protein
MTITFAKPNKKQKQIIVKKLGAPDLVITRASPPKKPRANGANAGLHSWANSKRREIKAQHSGASAAELANFLNTTWKSLADDERAKWARKSSGKLEWFALVASQQLVDDEEKYRLDERAMGKKAQ